MPMFINNVRVFFGETTDAFDSVLVILTADDHFVLVKNRNRSWEFPGGHREGNESFAETAKREAYEEAGAVIDALKYIGYYILPNGHTTVITCAKAKRLLQLDGSFETCDVDLFDELPCNLSFKDGLYEILINYLQRNRTNDKLTT